MSFMCTLSLRDGKGWTLDIRNIPGIRGCLPRSQGEATKLRLKNLGKYLVIGSWRGARPCWAAVGQTKERH